MVHRPLVLTFVLLTTLISTAFTQYYYKDILVSGQTGELLSKYRLQKIRNVRLESFEADDQATEGFRGEQQLSNNYTQMVTDLESVVGGASQLSSYFDAAGKLVRTVDTTDGAGSVSEYRYDEKGLLMKIFNVSTSAGGAKEKEEHLWIYNAEGKPLQMLRIKNETDTTTVTFVLDEKGNIAEENSVRGGNKLPGIFYFYDKQNRLTDIAGYNTKAQRLLPLYVFEYEEEGLVSSMMVVPEGSDDYQTWHYTYNTAGLKTKEVCVNKRKQILGRVEYRYGN